MLKTIILGAGILASAAVYAGPPQEEQAEEQQRELAVQMGDLYLRSITLGVLCGKFGDTLTYIEGYGEVPRVVMTFDEGFSGYVSSNGKRNSVQSWRFAFYCWHSRWRQFCV